MKRIANPIKTIELCSYGCGQTAKFINGSKKLMCCERSSKCEALRAKNSSGVKRAHESGLIPTDFGGKERRGWKRGKYSADFSPNGKGSHKEVLIIERSHCCEMCKNSDWLGKPITLELEHTDGNNKNNTRENLKLLCPNCHSQTPTWRGRGTNTGRKTVSDEDLLNALLKHAFVIKKSLMEVHMTPKGTNYERCYQLITDYKLKQNEPDVC